jgi:hypothetical protein
MGPAAPITRSLMIMESLFETLTNFSEAQQHESHSLTFYNTFDNKSKVAWSRFRAEGKGVGKGSVAQKWMTTIPQCNPELCPPTVHRPNFSFQGQGQGGATLRGRISRGSASPCGFYRSWLSLHADIFHQSLSFQDHVQAHFAHRVTYLVR